MFNKILKLGLKKGRIRKIICQRLLRFFYQTEIGLHAKIGENVNFAHKGFGCVISNGATIGKGTWIEANVVIGQTEKSNGVAPKIGENVYIGAGAILLGDITIGDGAKIAAGSVVITNVDNDVTVAGVPAKPIVKKKEKL